jgi:hypothetical protein
VRVGFSDKPEAAAGSQPPLNGHHLAISEKAP